MLLNCELQQSPEKYFFSCMESSYFYGITVKLTFYLYIHQVLIRPSEIMIFKKFVSLERLYPNMEQGKNSAFQLPAFQVSSSVFFYNTNLHCCLIK